MKKLFVSSLMLFGISLFASAQNQSAIKQKPSEVKKEIVQKKESTEKKNVLKSTDAKKNVLVLKPELTKTKGDVTPAMRFKDNKATKVVAEPKKAQPLEKKTEKKPRK